MKTRNQDISILKDAYKKGTPAERKVANESLSRIYRETNSKVIKAREKLIDAHRKGDHKSMDRLNHQLYKMRRD